MSKITRKLAKIFGSTAGANQIAEFGSLAASSPAFSTDPEVIQSLSEWLSGWFSAVIGANSPAIEDMNAFCYVMSYQIAYLMQEGVAEWNSATTYFIGSIVNDGTGKLYFSVQDNNLNHLVTDPSWWSSLTGGGGDLSAGVVSYSANHTLDATADGKLIELDTSAGSFTLQLPASPATGFKTHLKDVSGTFEANPLTIDPNGNTLEGLTSMYVVCADYWDRVVFYDGSKFVFVS